MTILDNTIKDKCFICKRIEVIHKMFIFSRKLHTIGMSLNQYSMEKRKKEDNKNDYIKR